ncbi:MAG: anthranilate phosphoribosyltransferase [Acidobacteria bacterium]|nr:anthranilate phosphoribosyltransferase [Acidobacteriota bacterium]
MTDLADLGGWPAILRRLVAGEDLPGDHAAAALADVLAGEATPAQIAGFVIGLRAKGETVEELTAMVGAMLAAAERVSLPAGIHAIDTCGTGGSAPRQEACFNVGTLTAVIAAGAGAVVCKHGGRAATATSSSADCLAGLGVATELGPAGVERCIAEVGMAFCFAPRYHPAMRHAAPVRRELGVPTVFNLLGPLSNPSGLRRQVLGVGDPARAQRLAEVLLARGAVRAMVVSGHDGLDELTTTTTSTVVEVRDGTIRSYELDPLSLGLPRASLSDLRGGDAAANVALAGEVLAGKPGAHRDIVVLNAAAALVVAGVVDELTDGIEASAASIDGGSAAGVLERLVAVSQDAAAGETAGR